MGFDALIAKVQQAEAALEARERHTGAQWRQLKTSWRAAWTPGRIVLAGLGAGFLVGHAKPLRLAGSGGALQLLTTLAGLFAGGSAQVAAEQAGDAAQAAEAASMTGAGMPAADAP